MAAAAPTRALDDWTGGLDDLDDDLVFQCSWYESGRDTRVAVYRDRIECGLRTSLAIPVGDVVGWRMTDGTGTAELTVWSHALNGGGIEAVVEVTMPLLFARASSVALSKVVGPPRP